jgi:hypothetical protein
MGRDAGSVHSRALRTTLNWENTSRVTQPAVAKENYLMTVLSLSFVLGMAVSLMVYFAWRLQAIPPALSGFFTVAALVFCPPFILSVAFGPANDSDLAQALIVGTIIFANAFLYAGVAAGGYFIATLMLKSKPRT